MPPIIQQEALEGHGSATISIVGHIIGFLWGQQGLKLLRNGMRSDSAGKDNALPSTSKGPCHNGPYSIPACVQRGLHLGVCQGKIGQCFGFGH